MDDALGWVDPASPTTEWDTAQVRRLARWLGYPLRWADPTSVLGVVEQVGSLGAEVVLLASSAHVDAVTLDRLMSVADVECASPRASFGRWPALGGVRR
ncbi:hypothetical protein J2W56_006101 [Nocardia kruczakiae]|uniref:Uncharacterized protein n=1 Tax=Nocardia kruczakiae TaxID=261477 RepID=A0ABU1XP61_9NOCA|nr:hypothetical protein [Nocardia kruczakiae]MDR7172340.1 hypothetical protein [Nocardia kruczakiae]